MKIMMILSSCYKIQGNPVYVGKLSRGKRSWEEPCQDSCRSPEGFDDGMIEQTLIIAVIDEKPSADLQISDFLQITIQFKPRHGPQSGRTDLIHMRN